MSARAHTIHRVPFAGQLCLSMIVKNEAAVIARCLASVRPLIGAWAIVDTGSTDGTQALIRELLGDLPGRLIERPWVDFATNRNQALDLAREHGDYAFSIDADCVLELAPETVWPQRLDAPGYSVEERLAGQTISYRTTKIMRHDTWRWHGVLHEYPAAAEGIHTQPLAGVRIVGHSDGGRSQRSLRDKYLSDAQVLEAALLREPDNARYVFYLGQSLRDAGEHARAIEAYRRRASMGGWEEEVLYARLQVGALLERVGAPLADIIDAYLAAHDARARRAEPLCALARVMREAGRHASAYLFASRATTLPVPDDVLFVDMAVYQWRARDEHAIAAWYVGQHAESAALCRALLADPQLPPSEHARIRTNLQWCGDA